MELKITPAKARRTYSIIINHHSKTNRKKPLLFNCMADLINEHHVSANLNTGTGRIEMSSATKQILDELRGLGIGYKYQKAKL